MIILLLPLALQACTVKEDREPCPCYLDVDYSAMLESKLLGRNAGNVDVAVFVPEETCQTTFRLNDCPDLNENIVERSMAQVVGVVHNRLTRDFLSWTDRLCCRQSDRFGVCPYVNRGLPR